MKALCVALTRVWFEISLHSSGKWLLISYMHILKAKYWSRADNCYISCLHLRLSTDCRSPSPSSADL